MQLVYSGTVAVPVEEAWAALSDLTRVAASVPGVRLDPAEPGAEAVAGLVTVPLGPLRLTYRGEAVYAEKDETTRRVVIEATGRDSHGEQAASARITAHLREAGPDATTVTAVAEVNVRGMSAPLGFAVKEFGTSLLRQFVTRLGTADRERASTGARSSRRPGPSGPVPTPARRPAPVPPSADSPDNAVYRVPPPGEPMSPLVPLAGSMAIGALLGWLAGRRRRS